MGFTLPQSRQRVTSNRVAQCGQTACVWKVSKGCMHWLHFQKLPSGGAVWQTGQAYPTRRGNFASRDNARACCSPLQQFIKMKAERMPKQRECIHTARAINPTTPAKPVKVTA